LHEEYYYADVGERRKWKKMRKDIRQWHKKVEEDEKKITRKTKQTLERQRKMQWQIDNQAIEWSEKSSKEKEEWRSKSRRIMKQK